MIIDQIKDHFENKKYAKITREVSKNTLQTSRGYIVGFSDHFILLQETDDFRVLGYVALPIDQIKKIRYGRNDKFYDKVMMLEGEKEKVGINYEINLSDWPSIFKSIKKQQLNVIVYCEDPEIDSFTIGPIIKTGKKFVYIQYFDACGVFDEKPTSIDFESITKVMFDDRYINVFSKYLRARKSKK